MMMTTTAMFSLSTAAVYGAVALVLAVVSIMCINATQNTAKITVKSTLDTTVKNVVKRVRMMRD